jgi:hypothetical protein
MQPSEDAFKMDIRSPIQQREGEKEVKSYTPFMTSPGPLHGMLGEGQGIEVSYCICIAVSL